jgi:DNA-binding NarL/FixJ family response regulator
MLKRLIIHFSFSIFVLALIACTNTNNDSVEYNSDQVPLDTNIIADTNVIAMIEQYVSSEWMFDSLKAYEDVADLKNQTRIQILIAKDFRNSGNYNEALFFLNQAEQNLSNLTRNTQNSISDSLCMAEIFNGKSAVYFELYYHQHQKHFIDSTFYFAKKSLAIGESLNNTEITWNALNLLGAYELQIGNYNKSLYILEKADSLHALTSTEPSLAIRANLAYCNQQLGHYSKGLQLAESCYEQSLQNQNYVFTGICLKIMSEIHFQLGDTTKSTELDNDLLLLQSRKDMIVKSLVSKQLLLKYQQEKTQKKVLGLYKEQFYLIRLSRILILSILLLIIVSLIIGWLITKNIRKKREILRKDLQIKEQESRLFQDELRYLDQQKMIEEERAEKYYSALQKKEQELLYQTVRQARLSRINQSIQTQLSPFINKLSRKKDQQQFKEAMQALYNESQTEPIEEFEIQFSQIYDDFYKKLSEINNELTRSELQLCALLRLNLSTKEIAELLNLSPTTIDQRRYNIRQKLKLKSSDNLNSYLIRI